MSIESLDSLVASDFKHAALVCGSFDPLHDGHVSLLSQTSQMIKADDGVLICGVAPDSYIVNSKHRPAFMSQWIRLHVVEAIRFVDYAFLMSDDVDTEALRKLRPRWYMKGLDWKSRLPSPEEDVLATLKETSLHFVVTNSTRSSHILQAWDINASPCRRGDSFRGL